MFELSENRNSMPWSRFELSGIILAAICFFAVFHERALSGFDPGSFALAIKYGYSIDALRPHSPGYPGFYLLWTAIEYVTRFSPHAILLLTNTLFAIIALCLTYSAAKRLFDERTATMASLLVLTNSLFLYYGSVGEMYDYDAAFSAFLVILLLVPSKRFEPFLYLIYGILGSFRLSSIILTLPIVSIVLGIRLYRTKKILPVLRDFLAVVCGTLLWLIPFVFYLGGWMQFVRIVQDASYLPSTLSENLASFAGTTLWLLGVPGIVAFLKVRHIRFRWQEERYAVLLLLILIPGTFFALKYMAKGYELLFLAPLCILIARAFAGVSSVTIRYAIVANLLFFFLVPYLPPSMRSVLNHRSRNASERLESALMRHLSIFAPTRAHITASDDAMERAEHILAGLPPDATVFVDNAAAFWSFPRSLQFDFPKMRFLMPLLLDSTKLTCFCGANLDDNVSWASLANYPLIFYLTDSGLATELGNPPGRRMVNAGRLLLYSIPRDSFLEAHSYVNRYFVREGG